MQELHIYVGLQINVIIFMDVHVVTWLIQHHKNMKGAIGL